MNIQTKKQELRNSIKQQLKKLSQEYKKQASLNITKRLHQFLKNHPSATNTIASYAATENEVNLSSLHHYSKFYKIHYPKCYPHYSLEFYKAQYNSLITGKYGILEPPSSNANHITNNALDVIIVPALAYNLAGERLGQGAGYYDRFLAKRAANTILIGVAFECQILDNIPTEIHDIRLDTVISDAV